MGLQLGRHERSQSLFSAGYLFLLPIHYRGLGTAGGLFLVETADTAASLLAVDRHYGIFADCRQYGSHPNRHGNLGAGLVAVLNYSMPVWMALMAHFFLGEHLTRRKVMGIIVSMAGMCLLMNVDSGGDLSLVVLTWSAQLLGRQRESSSRFKTGA